MKVRAPGRVNLIGEHTDYNQGFVLPIAIQLETTITAEYSSKFTAHSAQRNETVTFDLGQPAKHHWIDYIVGVARELLARGIEIHPQSLHIESTLPEGAGLSSSAALEVATALALLGDRKFDRLEIAELCQCGESDFVGMPCGIMDQYVSLFGRDHAALKIDCRTLESESVPLPDNVAILAVNSMVKHELGQSAYKTRVAECAEACRRLGIASLRDATIEQVKDDKRARHVVSENLRVEAFVNAARANDLPKMGRLFLSSHRSMRDDYEISCPEIDFLVDAAAGIPGCYGARMTGGGFGGCTVNLVARNAVEQFIDTIYADYPEGRIIHCIPSPGASKISETNAHGAH